MGGIVWEQMSWSLGPESGLLGAPAQDPAHSSCPLILRTRANLTLFPCRQRPLGEDGLT